MRISLEWDRLLGRFIGSAPLHLHWFLHVRARFTSPPKPSNTDPAVDGQGAIGWIGCLHWD
jgi:hypothetical protein